MKYTLICLLFLLPLCMASNVMSDETSAVATIENFLKEKPTDQQKLHEVNLACLELTRIGSENAVPVLQKLLDDERFSTVARTALTNIPGDVTKPYREILHDGFGPKQDAALPGLIFLDGETGPSALADFLKNEDDKVPFKVILRAVLELQSEETGTIVLDNMGNLPVEKQAALVANLGARKDTAVVPRLIEIAQGDQPLLQLAAIQALGEIGDLRGVDALLDRKSVVWERV